ncbi:MAG: hypothetical protein ACRYFS_13455 [Janthinobacterium lividum]
MSILHKAGFAVIALSGLGLAPAAQAQLTVTGSVNGAYNYVYNLTPTADTTQLTFSFIDPNVFLNSVNEPLSSVFESTPGNFLLYGTTPGTVLAGGTSETVTFTSSDPAKSFVSMTSNGPGGAAGVSDITPAPGAVSAPVPEASTTVSFSLLLALGMGGAAVAAKKKKAATSA